MPLFDLASIHLETCALCRESNDFRGSHVVSKFVWDWLKRTSASGYFRTGATPNLREQDGSKAPILCGRCEGVLSVWEKATAERLFVPFHDAGIRPKGYGDWFGKFCASVTWRILLIYQKLGLATFPEALRGDVNGALDTWRAYLLGERANVRPYTHHVLPLETIDLSTVRGAPSNMNRYFARSVDMDVVHNANSAFVYAKLCRLLIVGFIRMPDRSEWRGTSIQYGDGSIEMAQHVPGLFGKYMMEKAGQMDRVHADISEKQKAKLRKIVADNPDRVAESGGFKAMIEDVRLFGDSAFSGEEE